MITTDLYNNTIELEFIKHYSSKGYKPYHSREFKTIPQRDGWEIVYMPYGFMGKGFYYKRLTDNLTTLDDR